KPNRKYESIFVSRQGTSNKLYTLLHTLATRTAWNELVCRTVFLFATVENQQQDIILQIDCDLIAFCVSSSDLLFFIIYNSEKSGGFLFPIRLVNHIFYS